MVLPLDRAVKIPRCFRPLDFNRSITCRQDGTDVDADGFRSGPFLGRVGAIKLANESLSLATTRDVGVNPINGLALGNAIACYRP